MGRVDLPVPVPQRAPAGTGDHRCQFRAEPDIAVRTGRRRAAVFAGRLPGDTGVHIPHPISPSTSGHPRGEASSRPTEGGPRSRNLLLTDEIKPFRPRRRPPPWGAPLAQPRYDIRRPTHAWRAGAGWWRSRPWTASSTCTGCTPQRTRWAERASTLPDGSSVLNVAPPAATFRDITARHEEVAAWRKSARRHAFRHPQRRSGPSSPTGPRTGSGTRPTPASPRAARRFSNRAEPSRRT